MFQKTVLDNGVRIISEHVPHARTVAVGVWVEAGSRDEHDLNSGCSHFVEHMLFKGTVARSGRQIAREFDILGGTGNAFTTREHTCCYATVLDAHLGRLLDLLCDMFLRSTFSKEEVVRERQVILQEISMAEDTPDDLVHDLFATGLWGRHSLGRPVLGSREVVAAMDRKKLRDHVRRLYRPDKIVISAAGNLDHQQFVDLLAPEFSLVQADDSIDVHRTAPPPVAAVKKVYSRDLEQVHLVLGCRGLAADHPDRFTFILLNILLGGNMSSRLFQEIREERGLAYSVYSYVDTFDDCGQLGIYLGVDPESLPASLDVLERELARLRRLPVDSSELNNAMEYAMSGLFLSSENMEARMSRNARNEFTFGRYFSHDDIAALLNRVTDRDIRQLAEQIFSGPLTAAVLGPVDASDIQWGAL